MSDGLPARRGRFGQSLQTAPSVAVQQHTHSPCSASGSPTERSSSSSSATIGKRATVRQTRARLATVHYISLVK
ncbi:hypothetical protein NQZ68_015661 [Dissostichus eleginoides]|nr:hypothetical protein NQZ68_015661 [Dissostichus eleginoides]